MKCITCSQEIPDASTTCPYCNNKVEPLISASQALGVPQESVIPETPQDYKLPKDQLSMTSQLKQVQAETQTEVPAATNIPAPPPAPTTDTNAVGNIASPPSMNSQQSYFDATQINLDNVDLNANKNAQTLDYTQINASEKLGNTIEAKSNKKENKKGKLILIIVLFVLILGLAGGGFYFYHTQFQTADARIDQTIDKLFNTVANIKNDKFEEGSGSYKLSYTSEKNADQFSITANGKYGYNLPSKKIDIITNITSIKRNQELLDSELNVELYLENSRAYFLFQNFKNEYVYTDIDKSYEVIKDIESRFNDPQELLLFKIINNIYDNGGEDLATNYHKYITNISQNDVNYQNIVKGIRDAAKNTLKSARPTQKIENGNNVIRINLRNPDTLKNMNKTFIRELKNNQNGWNELVKIYGNESELQNKLNKMADDVEYQGINGDLIIVTDMFKKNLKYISIPSIKDDKVCTTVITPAGGGYKIVSKLDGREIVNVTYTKNTNKASTTETVTYKLKGFVYTNDVADNIDLELELVKDINPQKISVITRNSIDYQYLTSNDFNELASKIEAFGNLGVLFKAHYKGSVDQPYTEPVDGQENQEIPENPENQATEGE